MEEYDIKRLRYRRQYIFTPQEVECPFEHHCIRITSNFFLYTHIDLVTTVIEKDTFKMVLLGDIFDYEYSNKTNSDILEDIIDQNFEAVIKKLSKYTGNFVLFHKMNDKIEIVHDPTATKKIYYCHNKEGVWCASQPHLLARILKLKKTSNESKLAYYNSDVFHRLANASVGDTTIYDDIRQVLPNHYIDVSEFKVHRFWPYEKKKHLALGEVVEICAEMIRGYVESIAKRYNIMLPITAGKDSRTLLAATKNLRNETFYYINKYKRLHDESMDIRIPRDLFKKLDLKFNILDPHIPVDKDFIKAYYENNPFASDYYLPIIYNYYVNFSDKVNLPGNIATGSVWWYPLYKKKITVEDLLKLNDLTQYEHARETYKNWLDDSQQISEQLNHNLWCLFYWEERLGNWGAQTQQDKDIAQLDINPFNSRQLVDSMLSIRALHKIEFGSYPINKAIIKRLWPEILSVPINPGFGNNIYKILEITGLKGLYFKMKFS